MYFKKLESKEFREVLFDMGFKEPDKKALPVYLWLTDPEAAATIDQEVLASIVTELYKMLDELETSSTAESSQ